MSGRLHMLPRWYTYIALKRVQGLWGCAQFNGVRYRNYAVAVGCKANDPEGRLSMMISIPKWKLPIYHSERVSKKKSVFIAHATALPSPEMLPALLKELKAHPSLKRASHCMYAYRTFPSKAPDSLQVLLGQNDGGERGSGERLSRLLEVMECKKVIVVVSRWHGGVNLGSERWRLILGVAKEALQRGAFNGTKDS